MVLSDHDPVVGGRAAAMIVRTGITSACLVHVFTVTRSVALDSPKPRGDQPGHWAPRPLAKNTPPSRGGSLH